MVTRYFVVGSDEALGFKSNLTADNDNLPLTDLQSVVVGELLDERKIIKVILTDYILKDFAEQTGLDDPLTMEGVIALDVGGKFAGRTYQDVLVKFPELEGQVQVGEDEEGKPIMKDRLKRVVFSGE